MNRAVRLSMMGMQPTAGYMFIVAEQDRQKYIASEVEKRSFTTETIEEEKNN